MARDTAIAWADHTFNPWWGCARVSEGCRNCYAERLSRRWGWDLWGRSRDRRLFGDAHWREPLRWNREAQESGRPRRVFCGSMCDVFEDRESLRPERARLWGLIRETPNLIWMLLTKRPRDAVRIIDELAAPLPANVWVGTTIENARNAWRAEALKQIDCTVRFISYEPAIGPLAHALDLRGIDWVIYGGESGPGYRADEEQWAVDMLRACRRMGVAFFFKQRAGLRPESNILLARRIVREFPSARNARRHAS